jgi:hypothetical protein
LDVSLHDAENARVWFERSNPAGRVGKLEVDDTKAHVGSTVKDHGPVSSRFEMVNLIPEDLDEVVDRPVWVYDLNGLSFK